MVYKEGMKVLVNEAGDRLRTADGWTVLLLLGWLEGIDVFV